MVDMHILLTNDDGFDAPGLQYLAQTLRKTARVSIVAPDQQRSGASHSSRYFFKNLLAEERKVSGIAQAFMLDGTPADCVYAALFGLLDTPVDLVISGINRGPNFGSDVLYSGTVGAAMEALVLGYPAMAVSLNDYHADENRLYAHAIRRTQELLSGYMQDTRRSSYLLNVNVPAGDKDRGIRFLPAAGRRGYTRQMTKRMLKNGRISLTAVSEPCIDETRGRPVKDDQTAVEAGWCSVTPFRCGFAQGRRLSALKKYFEKG